MTTIPSPTTQKRPPLIGAATHWIVRTVTGRYEVSTYRRGGGGSVIGAWATAEDARRFAVARSRDAREEQQRQRRRDA